MDPKTAQLITKVGDIIKETVEEAGSMGVPSGHMYMAFASTGMTLDTYQTFIRVMVEAGLIAQRNDCLYPVEVEVTTPGELAQAERDEAAYQAHVAKYADAVYINPEFDYSHDG